MKSAGIPSELAPVSGTPEHPPLTFGIFAGMAGAETFAPTTAGKAYDPSRTEAALAQLQSPGSPFVIRGYAVYKGGGRIENRTPPDVERYLHGGRGLDENGWPTGPDRPPERQAAVLDTIGRTVYDLRLALNITHYTFFSLRDLGGDAVGLGLSEFGLVGADYTPKPAFETYPRLIAELGA
jgi:hypothetical protein